MQWSFDPVGGLGIAIALAVLLVATAWLIKPRGQAPLTGKQRTALVALRLLASLLLLFAWIRPTLIAVKTEPIRSVLLLLADSSRSMQVEDGLADASRWKSATDQLDASQTAIAKIAKKNEVHAYHFGAKLETALVEAGKVQLPESPEGDETAIGAALAEMMEREAKSRLMGVVLLSDGAQRAIPPRDLSPQIAARRLAAEGVPLYAFAIGDRASRARSDLAIEDLVVSERAFAGAPLKATGLLRTAGFPNRTAQVQLLWESRANQELVVDSIDIMIRPGVDVYPIDLTHTPLESGEWKLTVRAVSLEGETLTDNNEISTFVTVREGGIRVLYLAGATRVGGMPGIEQRFVRASLASSPDIVVERPSEPFNYRRPRRDLTDLLNDQKIDVLIVDDLDTDALDLKSWNRIAELVEQGAGLVMIGGRHSFGPGGHRSTPMADILPLEMGRAERQAFGQPMREDVHVSGPLQMVPALPRGERHPVMQLDNTGRSAWLTLPPLVGANRFDRARIKGNASVLAEADTTVGPVPLLLVGQPGLGRVLAFAGDSTWRWVLAGKGELHRRFWRQVILWLAKQEDESGSPVRIELSSRRLTAGSQLDIAATVRLQASEQKPVADEIRYQAKVLLPDGSNEPLSLPSNAERATASFLTTQLAGDYTVEVEAFKGRESVGIAKSRFTVPRQDLELDRPAADPSGLARLAEMTSSVGGKALAPEELPTLLDELAEQELEEKQQITSRFTPWDRWYFFLLLVVVMSTEWGLRRRWGMP